eukprot:TRINITY_DN3570_c0_g1_i1.p1 TRINITY_DN3570_c0_g1~~TRINITY_DN3570_c0_g1_i1.p1  ORF type:complete len:378 (-),score=78.97 TRINITY_DN3570_c0_g1_i1:33-1166(-)
MEKKDKKDKKDKKNNNGAATQTEPLDPNKILYGATFEDAARRSDPDWIIPKPWRECISYLEAHATDSEGIFRIPGSLLDTNRFIEMYNRGQPVTFELKDIDTVASLMIKFLQQTPSSLFDNSYDQFAAAASSRNKEAMVRALRSLSLCSREMLKMLCRLLLRIAEQSDKNKMTIDNLGICFGPSFSSTIPFVCQVLSEGLFPETVIFGVPLEEAFRRSNGLPLPLKVSMEFIEKIGIEQEDVYKESGSITKIKEFKFIFNSGAIPTYDGPADVANACGVIFAYLQALPDPVFADLKQNFVDVAALPENEQVAALKNLLPRLPKSNQLLLKELSSHLYRVSLHANKTKMTIQVLADTLGPTWRIIFVPLITHSQALWK